MLKIKISVSKMKTAFGGFINRLDKTKERINKFEDSSIETLQTGNQREKSEKKTVIKYPKSTGQLQIV